MITAICEVIIGLVVELFTEIFAQLALELGFESLGHSLREEKKANPILACIGIALLGALMGFIGSLIFRERVIVHPPIKGASLVLSPLFSGLLMKIFGDWRRSSGHRTSRLATFWGGALFAFFFALIRFLMIGKSVA